MLTNQDVEMTNESLQKIADLTADMYEIDPPQVQIKEVAAGRARFKTNKITIPEWIGLKGRPYVIYYVVHEVCHFYTWLKFGLDNHGNRFKDAEQMALYNWGMIPFYKKAYVKRLNDLDGNCLIEVP